MSSMLPPEPPVSGVDDEPVPGSTLTNGIVGAYGRDAQTDCLSQSAARGMIAEQPGELDESGYLLNGTQAWSLADEAKGGGWTPRTLPVGGTPARGSTAGTRGASDIGKGL